MTRVGLYWRLLAEGIGSSGTSLPLLSWKCTVAWPPLGHEVAIGQRDFGVALADDVDRRAGLLGVGADVAPVDEEERLLAVAFRRACAGADEHAQGLVGVIVGGGVDGVALRLYDRLGGAQPFRAFAVVVVPVPSPWVNAGAVAVRVVLGPAVPPLSLGGAVVALVGVVEVAVVVVVVLARGALVEVVPSGSGVLASTVFVPPPQPASSAASAIPRRAVEIVGGRSSHPAQ